MFISGWLMLSATLLEMILLWLRFFPCNIRHTITPSHIYVVALSWWTAVTVTVRFLLTFSFSIYLFLSPYLFLPTPCSCRVLLLRTISLRHTHSVGLLWPRDRPDAETSTWKHTTLTREIHVPGGFRTRSRSKRSAADPRLRPRGHWFGLSLLTPSLAGRIAMHFSDIHISHLLCTLNQLIIV
jgi:hypothetical protein